MFLPRQPSPCKRFFFFFSIFFFSVFSLVFKIVTTEHGDLFFSWLFPHCESSLYCLDWCCLIAQINNLCFQSSCTEIIIIIIKVTEWFKIVHISDWHLVIWHLKDTTYQANLSLCLCDSLHCEEMSEKVSQWQRFSFFSFFDYWSGGEGLVSKWMCWPGEILAGYLFRSISFLMSFCPPQWRQANGKGAQSSEVRCL